ncbi:multidrug resistance-associated ABC transporter [Auriculariales sp. MPI-PUGE-AT-0066]|nr:multidrug resistance-associated ABC transporter [Auriculariales sp. MPI-PUGE-AT-0066]
MLICPGSSPLDFGSECVRALWTSLLPVALILGLILTLLPLPKPISRALGWLLTPFHHFLSLPEAEVIIYGTDAKAPASSDSQPERFIPSRRRVILLDVISVGLCAGWAGFGPTPSYDLLSLWLINFAAAVLSIAALLYDHAAWGVPFPNNTVLFALVANLVATATLIWGMLSLPIAIPSRNIDASKIGTRISPEDYCTLWQWISFTWVSPLIARGTNTTLNEVDVWEMSPTMQSEPVFIAFQKVNPNASLLRRLWDTNSMDMSIDFGLTVVSVALNYTGPFFLNNILKAIGSQSTPEARAKAYVYAFLAFLASACKALSDITHLWHGRRASTRVRSILVAAIYEKGLRRKDFAGAVLNKEKEEEKTGVKVKPRKNKKDESTSGADIGKIVQLMSGDANRVANLVSGLYFLYSAPFEILFAALFLYQLMGWTAFAGFGILIIVSPINSLLTHRGIKINRELLAARDARMSVLNELIAEAKFIKIFAWESQWLDRAFKARGFELRKLIKSSINGLMFTLVWTSATPIVCIISFSAFILSGRELTVPIAFTALALFRMLSNPLNGVPAWTVSLLQTGVALERIATFLREDDVTEVASSLKRPSDYRNQDERLGIQHGNFKWNMLENAVKEEVEAAPKRLRWPWASSKPSTAVADSDTLSEASALSSEPVFELRDISIDFPTGKLTLVTGPTASGKTALLLALLGEMQADKETRIHLPKDLKQPDADGFFNAVSYAGQRPWLQHLSIRDNILFGGIFEQDRYDAVIDACALRPDLDRFEDGDLTEIGVRGVSLSGGQKARVALARAVYQRTRHVLLDDPLSAVDSHTARVLFDELLCGPLMKNRTVVLVTHHVDLVLPAANYLVRMLDGRIDIAGSVADLKQDGELADVVQHAKAEQEEATAGSIVQEDISTVAPPTETDSKAAKRPRKLVKDEARVEGSVKLNVYRTYMAASSYFVWVLVLVLILCSQGLFILERLWIKTWGEAYEGEDSGLSAHAAWISSAQSEHLSASGAQLLLQPFNEVSVATLPRANVHPMFYVAVFAAITLGNSFLTVLLGAVQLVGSYLAGKRLFRRLTIAVVRAPFRWHDVTPSGRLLNRFSKDIETVDSSLSSSMRAVTNQIAGFVAAVLTIVVVLPWFLMPASIIAFCYYKLAIGYLNTGRDLRRMESNARSPIFSGFSELLEGITTVRAFSAERRFFVGLHKHLDLTTQMWYSFWMMNRWLLLRYDLLGSTAVLITTLFGLMTMNSDNYAGWAGVTITSAMSLTSSIYWCCRTVTQLELDLNSVERVVEYLEVPAEPAAIIESNRPPAYWPSSTTTSDLVTVENLTIRYAPELPAVLHNVSFGLKPRERVGLLGRTGSGKSTLAMSLLRFTDPTDGKIVIDGIDITSIGVQDLRSRITIIPQDSALFSGTLRDNLDPFKEHSEADCIAALRRVHLIDESASASRRASVAPSIAESSGSGAESVTEIATSTETSTPKLTLDSPVSAGGANFSQGQRQLLAMARALLRQSSVIIFDEATSSIDFKSDARIQATIREEFQNSLLITVAHRIRTIIDFDRILVLDGGKLVEMGTPYELIQKQDGYFRKLCLQSGTFNQLEEAAATAASKVAAK